ncbi:MAG: beta-propeller fold lactonase family protein [Betaproteobacteria bacterium]|nr:beta-propeller fold lactonase family protein [Betaproteobacteria bacterium]
MKRRFLLCLFLAFSGSSQGYVCDLDDPFVYFNYVELAAFGDCDPPFPVSHVTTHTKDSIRAAPKRYLLDETHSSFSGQGDSLNQNAPKSKAAPAPQGIGATDATADQSGRYLYVLTNGTSDISAWQVDPGSGELTAIPGAPFKTGKDPTAVVVHPSNQFLYTANISAATVSWFRIDPATGALTALGTVATPVGPWSMAMHPSGRFLYITTSNQCLACSGSVVQAYAIDTDTGAPSALGNPLIPGAFPSHIAADPLGRYVYFFESGIGIAAFVVEAAGTLTRIPGLTFQAPNLGQLVMAPNGKFLYVLDTVAKTVSVFKIDRATGALSAVAGSPYAIGSNPVWLSVSPTGRFVLVADQGSLRNNGIDRIWIHAVDAVSGALTPIAGSPFATQPGFNTPDVMAINAVSLKSFAKLGADYANSTFHVKAGTPPYSWSISNGALPPGLAQNAQTGVIAGNPTQKGTFDFTVKVTDAAGLYARLAYFIAVNDTGLPGSIARVVEYYHNVLDNYFITSDPVEQAAVDAGAAGANWRRTGGTFKAGGTNQVCRFYGNNNINPATGTRYGPNSHFYTADAAECAGLKAAYTPAGKSWSFESNDFSTTPAVNGGCAPGLVPVYRAYNNGFARGIDSNHRITSSQPAIADMVTRGWISEGVVMCAPS